MTKTVSANTVAGRIAKLLKTCGVTQMFSQSLPSALVLAAEDIGIRQVTYRTENAGGAMADGYARVSKKLGIVCAQNGPAATLLVPPLAEALKASVPLLALVQEVPRGETDKNAFQDFDHLALFSSCTKWARTLREPARVDDTIRQAIVAATSGRPGPVAVLLPADVLLAGFDDKAVSGFDGLGRWPLDRCSPDPALVARAADILCRAEAPVVIAGGGVHAADAAEDLAALQERFSLPVGTTMMGKGSVREAHPLSLGLVGNAMGEGSLGKHTRPLIEAADAVLLVGSRTNQNGTDSWSLIPPDAQVIHLDVDGTEIGRNYPALRLAGDAKCGLQALAAALSERDLEKRSACRGKLEEDIAAAKARAALDQARHATSSATPLRPEAVMAEVARVLTPDSIMVADASYSSVWVNAFLPALEAGMRFLTPRGLAGLGWGYPMALGASLATPDRTVFCLAGDGGFGHVWSELETAVREAIPVVLLLLNNGTLGYQKDAERVKFGRHTGACYFRPVDHAAIARACGCHAVAVESLPALREALRSAVLEPRPILIEIRSDPNAYPPLTLFDDAEEAD